MTSLRSLETIQKEHDLQAEYTTRINVELRTNPSSEYKQTLEDYAVFANVLRKVVPEKTMVLLHPRPEVILQAEGEGYEVSLFISGRICDAHPKIECFIVNPCRQIACEMPGFTVAVEFSVIGSCSKPVFTQFYPACYSSFRGSRCIDNGST